MTGYGDIPMSVRAMKGRAIDFLAKSFRDRAFWVLPFENVVALGPIRTHGCAELVQIGLLGL